MLLTIVRKELLANLLSFKFAVSLALCVILMTVSAYVLKTDYKKELSDYRGRVMIYEETLRKVSNLNQASPMIRKAPAPLSVMFKRGATSRVIRDLWGGISFEADTSDPIPILVPLFDMGAIIGVILSLLAILFGYDALVSEKEGGTMKLMLSNSVSRSQVLIGKWIGGYISLLLPLAISALISLLIVIMDPMVVFHGSDWLALVLIFLGAMLYLSIFFAIAYFISAISRSFGAAALISLCAWLFIVLILPNVSMYIAGKIQPMPSIQEVQRTEDRLDRERNQKTGKIINEFMSKGPSKEEQERFFTEAFAEDGFIIIDLRDQYEEIRKAHISFEQRANRQIDLARQISAISPYANFTYLANTLSGTGVDAERDMSREATRHFSEWVDYIMEKFIGNVTSPSDINKEMDISDMPRFKYVEQDVSERFSNSLNYYLLLVIFNVVFFMAAYVAFLRISMR